MVLMPFAAVAEAAGIATLVPLLNNLNQRDVSDARLSAILFVATVIAAAILRFATLWMTQNVGQRISRDLMVEAQGVALAKPYEHHFADHSSDLIAAIQKIELLSFGMLLPFLQALASAAVVFAVSATLFVLVPTAAVIALALLALVFVLVALLSARALHRWSVRLSADYSARIRLVQDSLGSIRDILLDGSQAAHRERFRAVADRLARVAARTTILSGTSRILVELLALLLFAALALSLSSRPDGLASALPALGALALATQRLLPAAQSIFQGWTALRSNQGVANDVLRILTPVAQPERGPIASGLAHGIALESVRYRYPGATRDAIRAIDLVLAKGSRTLVVGPTGAGKSTLADLIMGLLRPSEGRLLVDGREASPTALVAHVPQHPYLLDGSVAQNIALSDGLGPEDIERIERSAELAGLTPVLDRLADGLHSVVGEDAIRLSGGERQRLALARAIYRDKPLLILDEATSALDDETESLVLRALDRLQSQGTTIVMIAHRGAAADRADRILCMEDGQIVERLARTVEPGLEHQDRP